MQTLKFHVNPNGKLFSDVFSDFRLADYEKFQIGIQMRVMLNNIALGNVEVLAYKEFSFLRLTDAGALINSGKGTAAQAKMIRRYYPNIASDSILMNVVFKWTHRAMIEQAPLFKAFFEEKTIQFPITSTLFNQPDFL